ncbi:AraC family transcriptional regulator, partial [Rhizobium leguminosarum]|nr:AraC family transcriptional regulator [Rhizobium leguminosarum]MDV4176847.1 AraC family transcriptional regulator [Rhizobium leguminosarum]
MSINQSLPGSDIDIFRKATVNTKLDQVMTPASDRGFVVGVSSLGGHTRRIFHEHRAEAHDFTENSIYIRNLSEAYKADLRGPFDFVLFEISPAS